MITRAERSLRGRDALLAATIAVVVGAVIAVPSLAPASGAAAREEAVAAVHLLGSEATARDALPAGFPAEAHGDGGVDPASARYLGDFDGDRYWTATDARHQVCVLVQSLAEPENTAASCAPPSQVERDGVPLEVGGHYWELGALLVPDSADTSAVRGDFVAVSRNLVALRPTARSDARLVLPRVGGEAGGSIVFHRSDADAAGRSGGAR